MPSGARTDGPLTHTGQSTLETLCLFRGPRRVGTETPKRLVAVEWPRGAPIFRHSGPSLLALSDQWRSERERRARVDFEIVCLRSASGITKLCSPRRPKTQNAAVRARGLLFLVFVFARMLFGSHEPPLSTLCGGAPIIPGLKITQTAQIRPPTTYHTCSTHCFALFAPPHTL